jgi:hypothetical protein
LITHDSFNPYFKAMTFRRLGPGPETRLCAGSGGCPDLFELEDGDFAIIGQDITAKAQAELPPDAGCAPDERIIRIPRRLLVDARADIPSSL